MFKESNTWHYTAICQALGYQFKNKFLLLQALTRQSSIIEGTQKKEVRSYQRLEFLGDSVLGLVLAEILYENNPSWNEGDLTVARSKCVHNSGPLVKIAKHLNLGEYLITGRGEKYLVETGSKKILSDHVEALFGAIFLDCGKNYGVVRRLVLKHWSSVGLLNTEIVPNYNQHKEIKVKEEGLNDELGELLVLIEDYTGQTPKSITIDKNGCDLLDEALGNAVKCATGMEDDETIDDIELLLKGGANPNSIVQCWDEFWDGDSPCIGSKYTRSVLQLAVSSNMPSLKVIQMLLDFGADPNWNDTILEPDNFERFIDVLHPSKNKPRHIKTQYTALHLIATRNHCDEYDYELAYQVVELLIESGADPALSDYQGNTPYVNRVNDIRQRAHPIFRMNYDLSERDNTKITTLLRDKTKGVMQVPIKINMNHILDAEFCRFFPKTTSEPHNHHQNIDDETILSGVLPL